MSEAQEYEAALDVAKSEDRITVMMLQRRLHIGYGRARYLLEELIVNGAVARENTSLNK